MKGRRAFSFAESVPQKVAARSRILVNGRVGFAGSVRHRSPKGSCLLYRFRHVREGPTLAGVEFEG